MGAFAFMADDSLSLLFRLKADPSQAKAGIGEARAAVGQLARTFGPELAQSVAIGNRAFESVSGSITQLVQRQFPLLGNAVVTVTNGLDQIGERSVRNSARIATIGRSINDIATASGKSREEVGRFLLSFAQIENRAERTAAAMRFLGRAFSTELNSKLEETRLGMIGVSQEASTFTSAIAAIPGPLKLAVVVLAALTAGLVVAGKEIFDLTKKTADFRGKLFDLSQQTGVNVETLSGLEFLARTTGNDIGNLTQSLTAFQRVLESAQDPTSKEATLLRELGIEATDTESALRQALASLAKMPEGFTQTNAAAELFGARGGKAFLAILKESKGDLDGTIQRLRELGVVITEADAKAADEFNDTLALLQFQIRALTGELARDALPLVLDLIREFSQTLKDNREAIRAVSLVIGGMAKFLSDQLRAALSGVNTLVAIGRTAWGLLRNTLIEVAEAYERIRRAIEALPGGAALLPALPKTETTTTRTEEKKPAESESSARRRLQAQEAAQRSLLATQTAFFEQEKTLAANRIALSEREFTLGQRTRREKLGDIIENTRKIRDADLAQLEDKRRLLVTEAALAQNDLKRRQELESEIVTLDQRVQDRRAQFDRETADAEAAVRKQEIDDEIEHQEALLEIASKFDAARIVKIKASVEAGKRPALEAAAEIASIENAVLDREQSFLVKKLAIVGKEPSERRKIADEIKKIEADRTLQLQEQENRRTTIIREALETQKQILLGNLDTLLQIEQIRGNAIIASIQALAALRVKTEEDAAREITAIRLRLIDSEIEAAKAALQAAGGIRDPNERLRVQAEQNNRIKILVAQRSVIESQGERDREEGRQRDLENERRYADELLEIKQRIKDIEQDAAKTVIDLMILAHADRREVINAQFALAFKEETDRHQLAQQSIAQQRQENAESNRTREEKLERDKELNALEEAEAERHGLRMAQLRAEMDKAIREAGPEGGFLSGLEIGRLVELSSGIRSFADAAIVGLSAVGSVVNGLAQGVGSLVSQWILLGVSGPGAMRKLVASVLAGVAAQAAVLAIFELAKGFAALFFNPAEAAAHFYAAALFGSIAAVSAVAGRRFAGDLFKPQTTGSGGAGVGASERTEPQPRDLTRNQAQEPKVIIFHPEIHISGAAGEAFTFKVEEVIWKSYNRYGPVKELLDKAIG